MGSMGGYLAFRRSCRSLLPQLPLATAEMPVAAGTGVCMHSSMLYCSKDKHGNDVEEKNSSRNNHGEQSS